MRQIFAFLFFAALSTAAFAQAVAFGNKLVSVGDPVGRVFEVAGQPSRTVPIENKFGAHEGERLEYFLGNKTVLITLRDGKVTQVQEVF
ncbi:hypothetical protein SAMN04487939_101231 [Lysobacter sp. yr284]|uniref:hypothetical protein n=1 Tax=Lysobacter sp. yr284 TaxID=1761791 RepID=UPI00089CE2D7|nr:hypothetical protein [Lysobacter sp. yr284]SDY20549.1 hypothetical protein SAMN04487939_101231 [Lysobacter sp. yr284]